MEQNYTAKIVDTYSKEDLNVYFKHTVTGDFIYLNSKKDTTSTLIFIKRILLK
jgi:hypothetical protein